MTLHISHCFPFVATTFFLLSCYRCRCRFCFCFFSSLLLANWWTCSPYCSIGWDPPRGTSGVIPAVKISFFLALKVQTAFVGMRVSVPNVTLDHIHKKNLKKSNTSLHRSQLKACSTVRFYVMSLLLMHVSSCQAPCM